MREFFHGWQQSAICMTVVIACAFAMVMGRHITPRMRINAIDDASSFASMATGASPPSRSKVMGEEVRLFTRVLVNELNESGSEVPETLAGAIYVVERIASEDVERLARYRRMLRGIDAWGEAIRYSRSPEGGITIWSCGRNGIHENGTGDDLVGSGVVDSNSR